MPAQANRLGRAIDWAQVTVRILGRELVGIAKISYTKKQNKVANYGAGTKPVSKGRGQIAFEGSIEIDSKELQGLIASAEASGQDILDIVFDVQVSFGDDIANRTIIDTLHEVEFTEIPKSIGSGDTAMNVTLPLFIMDIDLGV